MEENHLKQVTYIILIGFPMPVAMFLLNYILIAHLTQISQQVHQTMEVTHGASQAQYQMALITK
jgi:TRAP-type C4-dicarboxylate transport system permease small subunit